MRCWKTRRAKRERCHWANLALPFSVRDAVPACLLCLCTCPDADTARAIADRLVEERLCACVNLLPGAQSIYRWQGAVERAQEVLMLIKTTQTRYAALEQRLAALHPYSVPEIIALPIHAGLPAYLQWLDEQTRQEPSP